MGFKALNQAGEAVYSFNLNQDQWADLKANHKKQLKMSCCEAMAIPKTSVNGTPFFAHHTQGNCNHKPESVEHLFCKYLCIVGLKNAGWFVEVEKPLKTPDGLNFQADVYAEKRDRKIAFEVQWSRQSDEDFTFRTKKYIDSDISVFWLYLFDSRLTPCRAMPIFKLQKNFNGRFTTSVEGTEMEICDFALSVGTGKVGTLHKLAKINLAMVRNLIYCPKCGDDAFFDNFAFTIDGKEIFAHIKDQNEFILPYTLKNNSYTGENTCYRCGCKNAKTNTSTVILPIHVELKKESYLNKFILAI